MKKLRFLNIRSRHPSCNVLRRRIQIDYPAVYRHGSTNETKHQKEINSIESVKTASSKLLMKQAFDEHKVRQLPWIRLNEAKLDGKKLTNGKTYIEFPVVIKHTYGSRGRGNYKIETPEEFTSFLRSKNLGLYIVEQFFSGSREYRVHITADGPIYCLRKLLKESVPQEKRWVRNDETCVWIMEHKVSLDERGRFLGFQEAVSDNFDTPVNWKEIIENCKKALTAVKLDIGAVDLKVQSARDSNNLVRQSPNFYIIEINSAPSLGPITGEVYKKELPKILYKKYGTYRTSSRVV